MSDSDSSYSDIEISRPAKKTRQILADDDDEDSGEDEKKVENKDSRKVEKKVDDDDSEDDEKKVDDDDSDDDEKKVDDDDSDDDEKKVDDDDSDDDEKKVDDDDSEEDEKKVDDEEDDEDEGEDSETKEIDEEEDERDRRRQSKNDMIYDFDIMMAKKKEENRRKRRPRSDVIINDDDDIIAEIINQMKYAVEADNEANMKKMAAINKLKLLPLLMGQLRKVDLRDAFLEADVLSVITGWLAPLPDRSLPHLNIRESLLKILIDFNLGDVDQIKSSGIGKAVMYLYKHPKETKENKQRAKKLISSWSRPIFQLESNFSSISREEREQRDLELMSKQRRLSRGQDSSDGEGPSSSSGLSKKAKDDQGPAAQKPGDKGWIPRARVPAPSMKDYVIRPRSKVEADIGKSSKRPSNMLEKYLKTQQDRRRANKQQRAVSMKIDRI